MADMTVEYIDVIQSDEFVVDMDEAFPAEGQPNEQLNHERLYNRDSPEQHSIGAIKGLSAELAALKKISTVYSDRQGSADYYAWNDDKRGAGYFVSLVQDTTNIVRCNKESIIFGVTVEDAGFIGGYSAIPRGDKYALVAVSGLVDVRCESDIVAGDYVVSNANGEATKTTSLCGYRVVAVKNKDDVLYASIVLGVQANITDFLGCKAANVDEQLKAIDARLVAVTNTANAAYDKSTETEASNEEMSDIVTKNEEDIGKATSMSAQAKAVADDALLKSSESMNKANDAWSKSENLKNEEYSLRANIDTYSVGEYSQAYGLTLEQATGILEEGMIYTPVAVDMDEPYVHTEEYRYTNQIEEVTEWDEDAADTNKVYCVTTVEKKTETEIKTYCYYERNATTGILEWKTSTQIPTYPREFTSGYLYKWAKVPTGKYGWVTVDKYFEPTDDKNTSNQAVYIMPEEPDMATNETFGYWYTYGDEAEIKDKDEKTGIYAPYTLYCWEKPEGATSYSWVAKATLAGNVNNRIMNATTLAANEASFEIYNARGSAASLGARITETEAQAKMATQWSKGKSEDGAPLYNLAAVETKADANGSELTLVVTDQEGNKLLNGAGITLKQDKDGSSIQLDAGNITINGEATFTVEEGGETKINGSHISTGSLDASFIKVDDLEAFNATVGGWKITEDSLSKESIMLSTANILCPSLIKDAPDSPLRISAGGTFKEKKTGVAESNEDGDLEYRENLGLGKLLNAKIVAWTCQSYGDLDDETPPSIQIVDNESILIQGKVYPRENFIFTVRVQLDSAFRVLEDGSLYSSATKISGTGEIAGWSITEDGLVKGGVGFFASDKTMYFSALDESQTSPVRMKVDSVPRTKTEIKTIFANANEEIYYVYPHNIEWLQSVEVESINVTMSDGSNKDIPSTELSATIEEDKIILESIYAIEDVKAGEWKIEVKYIYVDPTFYILEDGSLYASAAKISGTIDTKNGRIGCYNITEHSLSDDDENVVLDATGITCNGHFGVAKISQGNIVCTSGNSVDTDRIMISNTQIVVGSSPSPSIILDNDFMTVGVPMIVDNTVAINNELMVNNKLIVNGSISSNGAATYSKDDSGKTYYNLISGLGLSGCLAMKDVEDKQILLWFSRGLLMGIEPIDSIDNFTDYPLINKYYDSLQLFEYTEPQELT